MVTSLIITATCRDIMKWWWYGEVKAKKDRVRQSKK